MGNVFLFTGENTYQMRREKKRWMDEFGAKHGPENLVRLDSDKMKLRELLDEAGVAPFIAAKRLVVVSGMPKLSKEEAAIFFEAVHPDTLVLFSEPKPDKRLGGTKVFLEKATVKEFALPAPKQLQQWIAGECTRLNLRLNPDAEQLLISLLPDDQELIASELEKLSLLGISPVTRNEVSRMVLPAGEQEIWKLSSLVAAGDTKGAIAFVGSLLRQGEDPFSLWSILIWILRSLTAVSFSAQEGVSDAAKVASATQVPFPTVRTLLPLAGKRALPKLKQIHARASAAERDLKTGGYRSTGEAPQELLALVDSLVIDLCSLKSA